MRAIELLDHDFHKVNLISLKGGKDKYRCNVCGCEGMRPAFSDFVMVSNKMFKKSCGCSYVRPVTDRPKKVFVIDDMPYCGLTKGEYNVVDAPELYVKFKQDVWVFSTERNEPIRLLTKEYNAL